jgi:hypothetical protein
MSEGILKDAGKNAPQDYGKHVGRDVTQGAGQNVVRIFRTYVHKGTGHDVNMLKREQERMSQSKPFRRQVSLSIEQVFRTGGGQGRA